MDEFKIGNSLSAREVACTRVERLGSGASRQIRTGLAFMRRGISVNLGTPSRAASSFISARAAMIASIITCSQHGRLCRREVDVGVRRGREGGRGVSGMKCADGRAAHLVTVRKVGYLVRRCHRLEHRLPDPADRHHLILQRERGRRRDRVRYEVNTLSSRWERHDAPVLHLG